MTLRIAWFASARGTSSRLLLRAALEAIERGRLDAEVVCVFCNRERGQSANTDAFLDDVEAAGLPLVASSSLAWRRRVGGAVSDPQGELAAWRRDYDNDALLRIGPYRPDLAVLAGYMLVTTDALCEALPMLNLHPALPDGPIGTWQEVIRELIAGGASESGMMLQRVTTELDRGRGGERVPVSDWGRLRRDPRGGRGAGVDVCGRDAAGDRDGDDRAGAPRRAGGSDGGGGGGHGGSEQRGMSCR